MKRKLSGIQLARRISLGFFLSFATVATILHQKLQNIPNVDSFCPFGGIETLYKFLAGGELLKKLEISNIFLFVAIVILGIVLSRFFCGWICAFGALQGIFGKLGRTIFKKRFTVPRKLDSVLRYLKYVILALILVWTWQAGTLVIRPYDPWAAYGHLSAGIAEIWAEFAVGLILLVLSLVLSMFYERAFCKYVCPLGAFNAILGRIPLFRIKREASTCTSCTLCNKSCPMNIDVMKVDSVDSPECISCMECVTVCPTKKGTLKTFLAGKPVKLAAIAAIGLAIYAAPIAVGHITGTIRFRAATLAELSTKGSLKVEDIKGSSTWQQVADSFGVELERLYREAGVDAKKVPGDTKLKDTGGLIGKDFEADAVRYAVAKIIGVPYSGESGEKPAEASPAPAPAPASASPASASSFALEGTMTLNDVLAGSGLSAEAALKKLELPADFPRDKPLRDLKDQYGYTMPDLKGRWAK